MRGPATPDSDSPAGTGAPPAISVLMYHSIADGTGPTSIAPQTFAMQMQELAAAGCAVVSLQAVARWIRGEAQLPSRAVAITFDDGFADFVAASRVLQHHGFGATVFLPTGRMGSSESWSGTGSAPRPLMGWDDVRSLAADGIEFGGHSITHPDLTSLDAEQLEREVSGSCDDIEERLGRRPSAFAAPYGASNATVRAAIARWYEAAAGTGFDRVTTHSDPFDIPRIEMFYFRGRARWADYLAGRDGYFRTRQMARAVGRVLRRAARR